MTTPGIGHNGGPSIGGLSTLPVEGRAVGGIVKGAKAGLKGLTKLFESVGSSLKKSGLDKTERQEAAKHIQQQIDIASEANNRPFKPKILRLDKSGQENEQANIVIAAIDEENGKVAAVLDGSFFKIKDERKTIPTRKGVEKENKNYGKNINKLHVHGFFPIQHSTNSRLKETLEILDVPIYAKGENVISTEQLDRLNKAIDYVGGQKHHDDKVEMGLKGTLGFAQSLRKGLPVQEAEAARISGSKGKGGELEIKGKRILETATPMEDLPDIDLGRDYLAAKGTQGLRDLQFDSYEDITGKLNPNIVKEEGFPSNVKEIERYRERLKRYGEDPTIRDPWAKRTRENIEELEQTPSDVTEDYTVGDFLPKEKFSEKLQYGLLNKLSGDLLGKKGLASLIKRDTVSAGLEDMPDFLRRQEPPSPLVRKVEERTPIRSRSGPPTFEEVQERIANFSDEELEERVSRMDQLRSMFEGNREDYRAIREEAGLSGDGYEDLEEVAQAFQTGTINRDQFIAEIEAFEESALYSSDEIDEFVEMFNQLAGVGVE